MKYIGLITLPPIALALMSCDALNKPLDGGDASNPLDPPGRGDAIATTSDPYGPLFTPGTFLQTVSPQTAFFANFPKAEDQPSKTLADFTDVKVISTKGSYVKVEVVDTGDVGYVPSVMLGEKRSPNEVPVTPGAGEVPVTPGIAPDPAPAASPDVPSVAPDPEVPGIQPPEVIDPSRPAE
ncbi:hypothetical protein NT6N_27650 [Oceaniferula spumae]|uniref:SH3 domain-containing protein n=1 Tax=Oceaniferula spumae TaxID=2979115 RepID=A0AAT9FNZ5_9BACT